MSTLDRLLHALRQIKHRGLLLKKATNLRVRKAYVAAVDTGLRVALKIKKPHFDASRYPDDFVAFSAQAAPSLPVPRTVYLFWTGQNPLTANRRRGLETFRDLNDDLEIVLVTPENLQEFLLEDHPLHPAYRDLSLVHKSDYLRCYFMNFFGGGYADIKTYHQRWRPDFERFDLDDSLWAVGYPEVSHTMTTTLPGRLGRDTRNSFPVLIGNGAFIMRPQTSLTHEWYRQLLLRMDHYAAALALDPGDARGDNPGYPVPWVDLLGNILPPLGFKYHDHVKQSRAVQPDFLDYQ